MIKLNYFNCLKDKYLKNGLKENQILNSKYEKNLKKVVINKSHPMMDWLDLPYQNKELVGEIQLFGKKISRLYENFVVIGIGGSALGAKAIKNSLYTCLDKKEEDINVEVIDNIDAETFDNLLNTINIKKTMFNIVTKSGTTVEIISMFAIILEKLKKELGEDYFVNLVVTTGKDNVLWNFCKSNKIKTYEIPEGVGGRYSVLTAVGLLPSAVMGINLNELLLGAKKVLEGFKQQEGIKNICYVSALINCSYILKGKKELVLLPYTNKLDCMTDFYIQLLSESLGKENLLNGKLNTTFFTPTKALGVTYQHSLLQMYQEGSKDRLFCFINIEKPVVDVKIPKIKDASLDCYLPKSLNTLNKQEQLGSTCALKKGGNPSYNLVVSTLNAENVGALLFYFELTTCLMAEILNINAFDQNGVEMQKKFTKALIGVKGFESQLEEIKTITKESLNFEIK